MLIVTMTCSKCGKDLANCEWLEHSQNGQDLQLWATDGHIVRFSWQAMPEVKECPKNGKEK